MEVEGPCQIPYSLGREMMKPGILMHSDASDASVTENMFQVSCKIFQWRS